MLDIDQNHLFIKLKIEVSKIKIHLMYIYKYIRYKYPLFKSLNLFLSN